jgi:hypothetical protein
VVGPVQSAVGWHLIEVLDRRRRGVPSLATLRPRIIDWLRFEETNRLRERLESTARIELAIEPSTGAPPAGEVQAPADRPPPAARPRPEVTAPAPAPAPPQIAAVPPPAPALAPASASAPAPSAAADVTPTPPRAPRTRPDFPVPMGPGGIAGAAARQPSDSSGSGRTP